MLQKGLRNNSFNMNCVDALGRGALTLAIDGENLEMVELLIIMGVETRDALLEAINQEFVEAVELLLEHEELIHQEGEPYVSDYAPNIEFRKLISTFDLSSPGKRSILTQLIILPK